MKHISLVTAAFAFLLISCGSMPLSTGVKASNLGLKKIKTVTCDGDIVSLSPGGKWAAIHEQGRLIITKVLDIESLAYITPENITRIDFSSISWSPDEKSVVFSRGRIEDEVKMYNLFVLEIEEDNLEKLTHDRDKMNIFPFWDKNGKILYFYRFDMVDKDNYTIHRISMDIETGTRTREAPFPVMNISTLWGGTQKVGPYFYYSNNDYADEPDNLKGLWRSDETVHNQVKLAPLHEKWGTPTLVECGGRGKKALLAYMSSVFYERSPHYKTFAVLDLEDFSITPIKETNQNETERIIPITATFSPDGSKVLYVYQDNKKNKKILAVKDSTGGNERILYELPKPKGAFDYHLPVLQMGDTIIWTQEDDIFWAAESSVKIFKIARE